MSTIQYYSSFHPPQRIESEAGVVSRPQNEKLKSRNKYFQEMLQLHYNLD